MSPCTVQPVQRGNKGIALLNGTSQDVVQAGRGGAQGHGEKKVEGIGTCLGSGAVAPHCGVVQILSETRSASNEQQQSRVRSSPYEDRGMELL